MKSAVIVSPTTVAELPTHCRVQHNSDSTTLSLTLTGGGSALRTVLTNILSLRGLGFSEAGGDGPTSAWATLAVMTLSCSMTASRTHTHT